MTKVNNIPKIINPHFLEEAGDYLVAAGYKPSDGQQLNNALYFFNGSKAVVVYHDHVDFMIYDEGGEGQRRAGYHPYMQFTGIDALDMFRWMLLFHIADVVPLRQFIKDVKKEEPADITGFMVQIFDHFRATEDHNAVPVNY